jgi:putative phage-type endonuclease
MPDLVNVMPGSLEWLAARRLGVTATDIVTVLGLSRWDSAYALYWRKTGVTPEVEDNDRFKVGRHMESYVVSRWLTDHTDALMKDLNESALYRSSDRPWQLATPDRLTVPLGVLECKSWADSDKRAWENGPPAQVRAQVVWQMDTLDVSTGHVAVVFLPSGEFRSYIIEHDESVIPDGPEGGDPCDVCKDIRFMRDRGWEFYWRLIGHLPPPPLDESAATLAALKARFGDPGKDKVAVVDTTLYAAWADAKDVEAHWKAKARGYEAELREVIGECGAVEVDGQVVARRQRYGVKAHWRKESTVDKLVRVRKDNDG